MDLQRDGAPRKFPKVPASVRYERWEKVRARCFFARRTILKQPQVVVRCGSDGVRVVSIESDHRESDGAGFRLLARLLPAIERLDSTIRKQG
jgi:hypothetical protein